MDSPENKERRRPGQQRGRDDNQKPQPKLWGSGRSMLFWLALFLLVFVVYQYFAGFDQNTVELTYTEFAASQTATEFRKTCFMAMAPNARAWPVGALLPGGCSGAGFGPSSRAPLA